MPRRPTPREQAAHTWSHAAGVVLGLLTLAGLLVLCADRGWLATTAVATYGLSLTALFLASTAYHGTRSARLEGRLQKADHCAIYLLIAGTYTPFTLLVLGGGLGWGMFATVWGLAVVGLVQELWFHPRRERLSLALYLGMGWLVLVAIGPLVARLPGVALALLALGGLLYSGGVPFYVRDRKWDHTIWHGFVLAGAASHAAALAVALG